MITDEKIIELFFERSEQGIRELDIKYGKVCHKLSYNIVSNRQDVEECVNDAYLGAWNAIPPGEARPAADLYLQNRSEHFTENLLQKGSSKTKQSLHDCYGGNRSLHSRPEHS